MGSRRCTVQDSSSVPAVANNHMMTKVAVNSQIILLSLNTTLENLLSRRVFRSSNLQVTRSSVKRHGDVDVCCGCDTSISVIRRCDSDYNY
jgi:hypothetical protein